MADRIVGLDAARAGLLSICALAVAHAVALILGPLRAAPFQAYVGASRQTVVPDALAGIGLLAAGLLVIALGGRGQVGALAMLASIAWWAPLWVAWEGASPIARSLGLVVTPFLVPLLLDLVISATAWPRRPVWRVALGATYAVAAVASLGRALVRDPFVDLDCGSNCRANVFLVFPDRALATIMSQFLEVATLVGAIVLLAYVLIRLGMATSQDRRAHAAVLIPGLLVGIAEAMYAAMMLRSPLEPANDSVFVGVFLARSAAIVTLAIGLVWLVVRTRWVADSVARLARNLAAATGPGGLRENLAGALGDPDLRVGYWLPRPTEYVDEAGRRIDVDSIPVGRVATPIGRGGGRIALVIHQLGVDTELLTRRIGAATLLAAENERLQAEVRWQIGQIQDSRRRIVATADDNRRRLERDLHDGAQQRMLALSYELRLAQAAAERDGPPAFAVSLGNASNETLAALEELRELAHGIFPAILGEAGLPAALETLADRSALPLRLFVALDRRCAATTETTAYLVIDDAIRSAARRGATSAGVAISRSAGRLLVQVDDDASEPPGDQTHLLDRVGALGGSLLGASKPGAHVLRAEIPCA